MLKIKNVTAKNFMSIGQVTQAVNFDNGQLTLVLGHNLDLGGDGSRNGTGKTTIINALSYGLYGDALTNIKKNNLINKTNDKAMMVTVDFEAAGVEYRIERGRRPNVLRLFINGVEAQHDDAQGDSRETQKEIERIVGFPHLMFKHIVALNTYTEPFLSMRPGDQRDMIEQLLGITDLSAKAEVLKVLLKDTRDQIKEEELNIQAISNSNERIEKNIREIETRSRAWDRSHEQKLSDIVDAVQRLSQIDIESELAAHTHNKTVNEVTESLRVLQQELDRGAVSLKRSDQKLTDLHKDLEHAEAGTCPSCGQGTSHLETHEAYIQGVRDKIVDEQKYHQELEQRVAECADAIQVLGQAGELAETFYDDVADAYEHKHNLESLAQQYAERESENNPYVEQIEGLRKTGLQEVDFETINRLSDLRDHQDFLLKLLTNKDSFIRKKIIDQNIAYLNHRLAHYLDRIGLPHEVKFSADLGVEITEFGRDLDFDNLSRGERNRLILSLSWAFRDVYESLNRPMNLMCIDELIDSGMDSTGVEAALGILKKMNREQGKNIFLISHKEELVGRVNNVLTVIKEGGFTSYSTDTDILP